MNDHVLLGVIQVVSLAEDANVVMLDWQTSGRMARGEMWEFTR